MSTAVRTRITVADLDRMIDAGEFSGPNRRRVELIEGELREMSPIGSRHDYVVSRIAAWSHRTCAGHPIEVRTQGCLGLPQFDSVPEPDVMWIRTGDYWAQRPTGRDVLLVIEVADSSLADDRTLKSRLYARAGIADYWIVDVHAQTVEVRRDPQGERFRSIETVGRDGSVSPLALPAAVLPVDSLFPPAA
jgi:Uma2 family endonuclease